MAKGTGTRSRRAAASGATAGAAAPVCPDPAVWHTSRPLIGFRTVRRPNPITSPQGRLLLAGRGSPHCPPPFSEGGASAAPAGNPAARKQGKPRARPKPPPALRFPYPAGAIGDSQRASDADCYSRGSPATGRPYAVSRLPFTAGLPDAALAALANGRRDSRCLAGRGSRSGGGDARTPTARRGFRGDAHGCPTLLLLSRGDTDGQLSDAVLFGPFAPSLVRSRLLATNLTGCARLLRLFALQADPTVTVDRPPTERSTACAPSSLVEQLPNPYQFIIGTSSRAVRSTCKLQMCQYRSRCNIPRTANPMQAGERGRLSVGRAGDVDAFRWPVAGGWRAAGRGWGGGEEGDRAATGNARRFPEPAEKVVPLGGERGRREREERENYF
ncbi:hypothetical protein AXF42_Ash018469 [Apostasia shenzhenica]|uniref:Uncharacterized protein n=1 Tax=Apostasia shenzhenica TaxID=1088818 RepID=A0A2H9ZZE9_9ASPA|nr:hypothetical protein AXF42_Ash018469 [Apostasia shenzhenica]